MCEEGLKKVFQRVKQEVKLEEIRENTGEETE